MRSYLDLISRFKYPSFISTTCGKTIFQNRLWSKCFKALTRQGCSHFVNSIESLIQTARAHGDGKTSIKNDFFDGQLQIDACCHQLKTLHNTPFFFTYIELASLHPRSVMIIKRLRQAWNAKNNSELANKLGVVRSAIANASSRGVPSDWIAHTCNSKNQSFHWIYTGGPAPIR